jgi:phosphoribosylamine--glycine ligase
MNVLILGSGAREHALVLAIARSPRLRQLFIAPGNPGCAEAATIAPTDVSDHSQVVDFCRQHAVDLVIVGPEGPLVAGIADDLAVAGVACFGPSRAAARLEGSKGFAKDFCREFGVPTGEYRRFSDRNAALDYVRAQQAPIVVKADGLAAGKGVVVASIIEDAEAAINSLFDGSLGSSGAEVVIEEFLSGQEVSFFAIADGNRALAFGTAHDHKRVGDGDVGPNTGGMGAYSPSPLLSDSLCERIMREIVLPTISGIAERGAPFRGVLFVGLMVGNEGPKVIEFNVRFGDPEAEVILPRLRNDLLEYLWGAAVGNLPERPPEFSGDAALAVVVAARGYPGSVKKGDRIGGLREAANAPGTWVLQGATRRDGDAIVADGGRVLTVTALGGDLAEARSRAYTAVARVEWPGGFCRRDIGAHASTSPSVK